jgi:hypothetical protein
MSRFTRAFVLLVAGGFFVIGLAALVQGAYKAAIGGVVLGLLISFIGGVAWFESRFPLPPLPPGTRPNLISEARRYLAHYPGWRGRVAALVIGAMLVVGFVAAAGRLAGW